MASSSWTKNSIHLLSALTCQRCCVLQWRATRGRSAKHRIVGQHQSWLNELSKGKHFRTVCAKGPKQPCQGHHCSW